MSLSICCLTWTSPQQRGPGRLPATHPAFYCYKGSCQHCESFKRIHNNYHESFTQGAFWVIKPWFIPPLITEIGFTLIHTRDASQVSLCYQHRSPELEKKNPLSNSKQTDLLTQISLCHSEAYSFVCPAIREIIAAHMGHRTASLRPSTWKAGTSLQDDCLRMNHGFWLSIYSLCWSITASQTC